MRKLIVFSVGGEEFGIDVARMVEVGNAGGVSPVPDTPGYIPGIVTVRGEVVPVLDLRSRFGVEPAPGRSRSLLVRAHQEKVGLFVDSVSGINDYDEPEISTPPSMFKGLKSDYITGIARSGGKVVIILNLDKLITSTDKIHLEAARESARSAEA